VVVSPPAAHLMEAAPMAGPHDGRVSMSVQQEPRGMGDAIFGAQAFWEKFDAILVVWGDQVFVSEDTLRRALAALVSAQRSAVLPLTRMADPYVEYVFENGKLTQVLQSREGDRTTPNGFSDVGTFLLATQGLAAAWDDYLSKASRGHQTDEINFLPFLPFLSARGWAITPLEVADADEARGINTPGDLSFFRDRYKDAP